jgi:hypothetical protein
MAMIIAIESSRIEQGFTGAVASAMSTTLKNADQIYFGWKEKLDYTGESSSVLTLSITNNQGMEDIEYGKIYDIYLPAEYLHFFEAPSCNI